MLSPTHNFFSHLLLCWAHFSTFLVLSPSVFLCNRLHMFLILLIVTIYWFSMNDYYLYLYSPSFTLSFFFQSSFNILVSSAIQLYFNWRLHTTMQILLNDKWVAYLNHICFPVTFYFSKHQLPMFSLFKPAWLPPLPQSNCSVKP